MVGIPAPFRTDQQQIDVVDQFSWNASKSFETTKNGKARHESIKAVQAKVLSHVLDVDKVAGAYVLEEVKKFAEVQGLTRHFDFKNGSIEEYIEFRHLDLGT